MRCLTVILLILALVLVTGASAQADGTTPAWVDFEADIYVTVTHGGAPLEGAVVKLDLDNNGIWEEHEPQVVTGADGVTVFSDIVSIQYPGDDDPADVIDWQPSRIMTGNLRGAVGSGAIAA
jgi:hypothetical protein